MDDGRAKSFTTNAWISSETDDDGWPGRSSMTVVSVLPYISASASVASRQ